LIVRPQLEAIFDYRTQVLSDLFDASQPLCETVKEGKGSF